MLLQSSFVCLHRSLHDDDRQMDGKRHLQAAAVQGILEEMGVRSSFPMRIDGSTRPASDDDLHHPVNRRTRLDRHLMPLESVRTEAVRGEPILRLVRAACRFAGILRSGLPMPLRPARYGVWPISAGIQSFDRGLRSRDESDLWFSDPEMESKAFDRKRRPVVDLDWTRLQLPTAGLRARSIASVP